MIILRYKYFNEGLVIRWPVPNPSLLLYPKIEKTNRFKKEYELIGKDARKLVDRLEESLMNGYIYEDDPDNSTKEETHCLEDFNEYLSSAATIKRYPISDALGVPIASVGIRANSSNK